MAVKEILKLGNPILYKKSVDISKDEIELIKNHVNDLHDTLFDFRNRYGCGRAIAAPQLGVMKRLIYMNINKPIVFINPTLDQFSPETFEVWDDCMSFPELLVKVLRYKSCRISFKDTNWNNQEMLLSDDLSELIQHEFDHLNGILAVQRAIDKFSFAIRDR
ncbi:MAG: peptide deformylase [Bacteroidales bacterium]|nr:MAG: peptide deformylase [Bacteroidales bacterium]